MITYCNGTKQCDRFWPVTPPSKCDGGAVTCDRCTKVRRRDTNFAQMWCGENFLL